MNMPAIFQRLSRPLQPLWLVVQPFWRAIQMWLDADGLRMSAVFQEDRLLEQLTAAENVRFVCGGLPVETETLLLRLGLEKESLSRSVREFSGGMKRRVAIARALLADFDILFLDEPYKGLDAETKRAVQGAVGEYTRNKTVVLVTHDPAEAEGYRLVEMKPIV